jgi:hypothetical protein
LSVTPGNDFPISRIPAFEMLGGSIKHHVVEILTPAPCQQSKISDILKGSCAVDEMGITLGNVYGKSLQNKSIRSLDF